MAEASSAHNPDAKRVRMIVDNHQADKIRKGMMINHKREELFT